MIALGDLFGRFEVIEVQQDSPWKFLFRHLVRRMMDFSATSQERWGVFDRQGLPLTSNFPNVSLPLEI